MEFNFPLILVILVAVSGGIALFDLLVLRKPRQQKIAEVENRFKGVNLDNEKQKKAFDAAHNAAASEPVAVEYAKSFFPVLAIVLILRSFVVEPFQIPSESMVPTLEVGDFILVNKFTYGLRLPVIRTKVVSINEPQRGDVMVFFPPGESRYFIKRVIGVPGDRIKYEDNVLYINGEMAAQEFIREVPAEPRVGKWIENPPHCTTVNSSYHVVTESMDGHEHNIRKCIIPSFPSRSLANTPNKGLQQSFVDADTIKVPEGHYFMMGDNRDNSSDGRYFGFVPEERIVGKAFAIWMHWKEKLSSLPSFKRVGGIQ